MIRYLSKIIKLHKLHVVGLVKKEDGERFHVLTLHKKANKINVIAAVTYDSFEAFAQATDTKLPVLAVLDGKGVLNKKIDFNAAEDLNWNKTIDYKTIYHTSYKSETFNFMSFCRETAAQEFLLKLQKSQFHVLDLYAGSFLGALLKNVLAKATLPSGELVLHFEDDKLVDFSRGTAQNATETYTIGADTLQAHFLPLYGAALHFFLQPKEVTKSENKSPEVEEIVYKKAFSVLGATMLGGFLIALSVSYFLIQFYGSKNAELNLQNVYSAQTHQQMQQLELQREKQLAILNESGFTSSKFLSFYAFELMQATPSVIKLSSLNMIPMDREVKPEKKISFETRNILLQGESAQEAAIHSWISKLRTMKWIRKFEIISLKKDKKNVSQFEIKITLADV